MDTVFVVDDDRDITGYLQNSLERFGYKVYSFNSGRGVYEAAKKAKPSVFVIDVMLPFASGYEICRRIRQDEDLYKSGICLITSVSDDEERRHALAQGADTYVTKPFTIEQVVRELTGLCHYRNVIDYVKPLTQLRGTEALKREVDHRLARKIPVAVCYLELADLNLYQASAGQEQWEAVLVQFADLLRDVHARENLPDALFAHMGGAFFAAMVRPEEWDSFTTALQEGFRRIQAAAYPEHDLERGYVVVLGRDNKPQTQPLFNLQITVVDTSQTPASYAEALFETLAHTRKRRMEQGDSSVTRDERIGIHNEKRARPLLRAVGIEPPSTTGG